MRFPGFEGEWEKFKVSDLLEFFPTNSLSWEQLEYNTESLYNLHYGLIHKGLPTQVELNRNSLPNIKKEFIPSSYTICENGDIAFADASEDTNDVGKVVEFSNCADKKVVCGLHTIHGRDKNNLTVVGFKGYAFSSIAFRNQIKKLAQGTKVYSLSSKNFNESYISIPSKVEQMKVAYLLYLIDYRIETQNKIIDQYESLIKGLSESLFSKSIRFKDKNRMFFSDWKNTKLGEISTITTGSSNREDSVLDGEFIFFDRSQDIRTSVQYLFDKEAIIIPGEGQKFIPKYYIGKFDLHQRTYAIFDFVGVVGKFLYYYIYNQNKYLLSQAVGSTVKSLRLPIFQSMPIKLPCVEEQDKIAGFLSSIDRKIEVERNVLIKYQKLKAYLLFQMFI